MAPIERWYKKWEAIEDSESEADKRELSEPVKHFKHLPPDIATSLSQERNPEKREALLALNSFIAELHQPPQATPAQQQRLLPFLSRSLHALQEGGEVERLVWQVHAVLHHPKVSFKKLEECAGACALLQENDPVDPRLVSTILMSSRDRIDEFSASSLARTCWSAASLVSGGNSEATLLLEKGLAAERLTEFVPDTEDVSLVSLLAWACAQPRSAPQFFAKLQAAAMAMRDGEGGTGEPDISKKLGEHGADMVQ